MKDKKQKYFREYLSEVKIPVFESTVGLIMSLKEKGIKASFSSKSSPWQNGYQESFYSEFKKDLGQPTRFETIGEFMEAIYLQVHYYNNRRIHTALKMPPALYAKPHLVGVC